MNPWPQLPYFIRRLRRKRAERDLDEEIRSHLEAETALNVESGMSPDEARRAAVKRFGSVPIAKEDARSLWSFMTIETFLQDVKYAVRLLVKKPGFTAIAVATLAVGIGANTAVFSIVNSILVSPLAYPDPQQLVQPEWYSANGDEGASDDEFGFWKEHVHSFHSTGAYAGISSGFNIAGQSQPLRAKGLRVTAGFFSTLGVAPLRGRTFLPEDDRKNAAGVCLISDELWHGYFGGDETALGRSIQVNGAESTIVGILPPSFRFDPESDVFVPLAYGADAFDQDNTDVIARLNPGVTIQQAQAEIDSLMPDFRRLHSKSGSQPRDLRLIQYKETVVGETGSILLLLFGAVGFVLAVACANVAGLLLARTAGRRGEIAVRAALGAGRLRLIRQLWTEALVLAVTGAATGILLAYWSLPALLKLAPAELPRWREIALDWRAVVFAAAVSIVTSGLFSIAPALLATRSDTGAQLKESGSRTGQSRMNAGARKLLIAGEVAMSFLLLAGAGLLIRSFMNLNRVDLGFDPQGLYAMQLSLNSAKYQTTADVWRLERNLIERISQVHGVKAVATSSSVPFERGLRDGMEIVTGGSKRHIAVEIRAVSPDYFHALGITLLRGRSFNDSDTASTEHVAVMNQTLARAYGPDYDPISHPNQGKLRVIGIVTDVNDIAPASQVRPTMYVPVSQVQDGLIKAVDRWFLTSCLFRADSSPNLKAALTEAVRDVDPQLPVASIRPMNAVLAASMSKQRFLAFLMAAFAAIALLLSALGLYGVLSYQVKQRTVELGIKMALGASRREIVGSVVKEGMMLTAFGLVAGLIAALALSKMLSG
ncbi:MAG TPA: ABC transporter permease, partial [Blastocatellia bacterium]|nr:ABC transporter permease [Blastocatellia bacterium]